MEEKVKRAYNKKSSAEKAAAKNAEEINNLKKENAEMKEMLTQMMGMMQSLANPKSTKADTPQEEIGAEKPKVEETYAYTKIEKPVETEDVSKKYKLGDDVVFVHLVQRAPGLRTHITLSNRNIDFSNLGEETLLTAQQADELVGAHRKMFEKGILAVGKGYEEYAKMKRIKVCTEYPISKVNMESFGTCTSDELDDVLNKVEEAHKKTIYEFFKQKIVEGDVRYKDLRKIEVLDRHSNGGFKYERDEILGNRQ